MDDFLTIVGLAVAILVVVVGGGLALLRRPGRRQAPPAPKPGVDYRPGVGDDAETPRDTPTRTIQDVPGGVDVLEPELEPVPTVERPDPVAGRMVRLRARLARSNTALGKGLLALLTRDRIDEATWDEVEETLLLADLGTGPTTELVDRLRGRVAVEGTADPVAVRAMLREELIALVDPGMDRSLSVEVPGRPAVVLVVGVNGTGKTTTVGKLARVLVAQDKDVVLGAADTFRAAAAEQLATWGERVGVPTIRSDRDGADPASVAFEAVQAAIELEADVVVIDTAGRLQNKAGLMDELGKVKRVAEKAMGAGQTDRRGAAGARRHHRPERAAPGAGVRRGGRRQRHRPHQARRDRQGRHRRRRPAPARRPGEAGGPRRGGRRPGPVRARGVRRRAAVLTCRPPGGRRRSAHGLIRCRCRATRLPA